MADGLSYDEAVEAANTWVGKRAADARDAEIGADLPWDYEPEEAA